MDLTWRNHLGDKVSGKEKVIGKSNFEYIHFKLAHLFVCVEA